MALGGVWLALVAAIVACLFLIWWPDFYTGTVTELGADGTRRAFTQSISLIEENGPQIIAVLLVPVALALIALGIVFMRAQWRWARWLLWGVTLLAWVFSVLGSFTVGAVLHAGCRSAAPRGARHAARQRPIGGADGGTRQRRGTGTGAEGERAGRSRGRGEPHPPAPLSTMWRGGVCRPPPRF